MSARTLYYVNGSIPSWRVLLALHEKGLPFEPRRLRVMREPRETRTPEFLAINPRGQTPVLVEPDGTVLAESLAILPYLELRYPDPPLLPRAAGDAAALARALQYAQEAEVTACAYDPLEQLFGRPADFSADQLASITGALAAVERELALWEERAARGSFIASEAFTLADCALYPVLAYMLRRGLSLEAHPALAAYEHRVRARPAAAASYPEGWAHDQTGKPDLFALARSL